MSGGVDSSVAAGLLGRAGYEVTGVFMCLGQATDEHTAHPGCCSPRDAQDARQVAKQLGIDDDALKLMALDLIKQARKRLGELKEDGVDVEEPEGLFEEARGFLREKN